MAGEKLLDIKFRLADGSDIAANKYSPSMTVGTLKERIIAGWPKDKSNRPKAVKEVKLINGGKILENHLTLEESRAPFSEGPGSIITMHIVVQKRFSSNINENLHADLQMGCSCSIL